MARWPQVQNQANRIQGHQEAFSSQKAVKNGRDKTHNQHSRETSILKSAHYVLFRSSGEIRIAYRSYKLIFDFENISFYVKKQAQAKSMGQTVRQGLDKASHGYRKLDAWFKERDNTNAPHASGSAQKRDPEHDASHILP